MKVYRIENKKGEGPYRAKKAPVWLYKGSCKNRPDPSQDSKILMYLMRDHKAHDYLCGFKDLKQLFDWFSPKEIEQLLDSGFKIVEMKVHKKFVEIGRTQIMFHKFAIEDSSVEWKRFSELVDNKKFQKYLNP